VPALSQHPEGQVEALQTQAPLLQVWPVAQALPQPPQFLESLCSSTQAVPHAESVPLHVIAQALPLQVAAPEPAVGPGQLVPQADPQLLGSSFGGQAAPQACDPALHLYPQVVPPPQVGLAFAGAVHVWQAAPAPQWTASPFAAQNELPPVPHR